jgi:crossover junction endodeoxyribonuclease RuvC
MARILGIDPGLGATGWGLIEAEHNRLKFLACGTIHTDAAAPLPHRLNALHEGLARALALHKPHVAAIEETFVNRNPLSSLKLGHARGALMLTVSLAGVPITEYAATLVKKSIVGRGRAEKEQIGYMVKLLLPGSSPDSADAADALAVAICHAHHATMRRMIST